MKMKTKRKNDNRTKNGSQQRLPTQGYKIKCDINNNKKTMGFDTVESA